MNRLLMLCALVLLATPLFAHKGTLTGSVRLSGSQGFGGTTVTARADPLWGHADATAMAITESARGKYPVATASGSTATDVMGAFSIEIEFSFEDDAAPPKRNSTRNGERVEVGYCAVLLTVTHPGYQRAEYRAAVEVDGNSFAFSVSLNESVKVRGSVLMLKDRSPVSGQTLRLFRYQYVHTQGPPDSRGNRTQVQRREVTSYDFTTDADGKFEFTDDALQQGQYALAPAGCTLAFAATSRAAGWLQLNHGDNDLGALVAVPGGSIKFRIVDGGSDQPVDLPCTMQSGRTFREVVVTGGVGEAVGLIEGDWTLNIRQKEYWDSNTPVKVEAGIETDLGDVRIEPMLSIDVIALSDGSGIEQYRVRATLVEGTPPFPMRDNRSYAVDQQLTVERTKLHRLFRGKWLVSISAANHASQETEVELPTDKPVTLTLEQGGTLSMTLMLPEGANGDFETYAVNVNSPLHEELVAMDSDKLAKYVFEPGSREVFGANSRWGQPRLIESLPAGKYLVICRTGQWGVMKQEQVEVKKGETTTVEFKPVAPSIALALTRDGKPAAGEMVYLCLSDRHRELKISEHETDKDGKLEVVLAGASSFYVLTQRERDWLGEAANNWEWRNLIALLKGQPTEITYGQRVELTIELVEPGVVWLKVNVKAPDGVQLSPPTLVAAKRDARGGWLRYAGRGVADGYLFARVPMGEYTLHTATWGQDRQQIELTRQVVVDSPPEQTIEVEFEIRALSIRLTYPKSLAAQETRVRLFPLEAVGDPHSRLAVREARPNAEGRLAFVGIEEGVYLVSVIAYTLQGEIGAVGSARVDSAETSELDLALTADFGTLEVDVEGNPAIGDPERSSSIFRIQLFDEMDEEALPADPSFAFGTVNRRQTVHGVPPGSYRALVTAYGLQAAQEFDVIIKNGEATRLTFTPSAAGLLKLVFEGITTQGLVAGKATSTYLDASGNEVNVAAPGGRLFSLADSQSGKCEARLLNLTPAVTRVLIRIEGYEDIEITVEVEPGKTLLRTVTAKRRAD
ncbi:MAG: hypothetical protein IPK87_12575 [Planctomycetes bacterium]|nr:hypothetical protein [Planctomycetota bacterium]